MIEIFLEIFKGPYEFKKINFLWRIVKATSFKDI